MMDFVPGKVVAGKYRLDSELGQGGAGKVFIATHLDLQRKVALKVLLDSGFQAEELRKRFEREARVASRLKHPNAVEVYDFGTDGTTPYLVMELLSGKTLLAMLKAGPLELETIYALGSQIADVLDAAHEIGLVHRDLKPENILVETKSDGAMRPVIVDFGLAFIAIDNDLNRMTQEGVISGTPQYLSPEQVLAKEIGPESDIYSFGCVLYEMITQQRVFRERVTVTLLAAHLYGAPEPLRVRAPERTVPPELDELVLRMLAKAPKDRPQAAEVRDALLRVSTNEKLQLRGRPEALSDLRSRRAVTAALPVQSLPSESQVAKGRVLVVGDIDSNWSLPLQTGGWECVPFSPDIQGDVIILTNPEPDFLVDGRTVIALADPEDFERCTALLKSGVTDIVSTPVDPAQLLKKIDRAVRRKRRGGHE